ncbi:hypothetical protein ACWIGI_36470 [Nocardia sp. NPDC055321]
MRQHDRIPPGIISLRPGADVGSDVRQLLGRVRTEAVVAVSSPLHRHSGLGHSVIRDLLATGKQVRLLYSPDYLDSGDRRPLLEDSSLVPEIRVTSGDFHNTFIIDRHAAVLWSGVGARQPYMVLVRDPALIGAIHRFATMTWESAERIAPRPAAAHIAGDERAMAILGTLDRGLTDDAAARELNISLRTYRRGVADLICRLGVTTRFQIGARAAQWGLLRSR